MILYLSSMSFQQIISNMKAKEAEVTSKDHDHGQDSSSDTLPKEKKKFLKHYRTKKEWEQRLEEAMANRKPGLGRYFLVSDEMVYLLSFRRRLIYAIFTKHCMQIEEAEADMEVGYDH